jgi:site-specific DNA recombinase
MAMAALYARVSSERQKEEQTIASQVAALQEHAQAAGYTVPAEWVFQDEGYSGAVLVRPALERLRDLVAEGAVEVLLVHAPDRLSRKYAYQVLLLEEFARRGTQVVFLKAPAGASPEEQLVVQFQGMIAEYERAMIAERTRRGKKHRARSGSVNVLSGAPYGYRYVRRTELAAAYYEVLPAQAEVVQEVFRHYTSGGESIAAITRWLNERQLPTRTGQGRWERSTVWAMLRNPAYKGVACFGKTEAKARQRITRRLRQKGTPAQPSGAHADTPRESWIEIPVPALVDERTFAWAGERLEANKRFRAGHTAEPSLLQGLLVCEQCSYAYYRTSTRTSKRLIYYYRCLGSDRYRWSEGRRCDSRPVRQDYLDNLVWEQVVRLLKEPELVRQELERRLDSARRLHSSQDRRDTLSQELARLARSSQKLMDAYQEDLLQLDELRPRLRALRQRQAALEAEQRSLAAQQVDQEALLQITHTVDDFLKRLNTSAQSLDPKQRQQVLRLVVREVVVGRDSVRIRHSIPASRPGPPGSPRTGTDPASYLLRTGRPVARAG